MAQNERFGVERKRRKVGEREKLVIWDASENFAGQVQAATAAQHDGKEHHHQHLPRNLIVTIRTRLHLLSITTDKSKSEKAQVRLGLRSSQRRQMKAPSMLKRKAVDMQLHPHVLLVLRFCT